MNTKQAEAATYVALNDLILSGGADDMSPADLAVWAVEYMSATLEGK